jgi:hypothetical protein
VTWNTPPEERFEREHGCTDAEWRGWLPGAAGLHALSLPDVPGGRDAAGASGTSGTSEARIALGQGSLHLAWETLPPRRIALISMPRMTVRYRFEGVPPEARQAFMRYFDLYMQRGGG